MHAENAYLYAEIFWAVSSFCSQIILCWIFWSLGRARKKKEELECNTTASPSTESEEFPEIKVEEFDESAELMARIWNQFSRQSQPFEEENFDPDESSPTITEDKARVTMQQIMLSHQPELRSKSRNFSQQRSISAQTHDEVDQDPSLTKSDA